jgi:hypothetical protein
MSDRLPNFLYIGPDKAGSSWLHEVLIRHPEIYLSPAKDLYFFDRYFDRGIPWYARQFEAADEHQRIVGEICQDYLFHPQAAQRIDGVLGEAQLMVTLRDPADRAFSSYLYMLKHGIDPGTFAEALTKRPELVEHGRYATGLRRYLGLFDKQSIHVAVFDDLVADPQGFIDDVLRWLDVAPFTLDDRMLAARLPASKARSTVLARLTRTAADWAREHDRANLVGMVKRSPITHKVLYQTLEDRPQLSEHDRHLVHDLLGDEIADVEELFGLDLRQRWGWQVAP